MEDFAKKWANKKGGIAPPLIYVNRRVVDPKCCPAVAPVSLCRQLDEVSAELPVLPEDASVELLEEASVELPESLVEPVESLAPVDDVSAEPSEPLTGLSVEAPGAVAPVSSCWVAGSGVESVGLEQATRLPDSRSAAAIIEIHFLFIFILSFPDSVLAATP